MSFKHIIYWGLLSLLLLACTGKSDNKIVIDFNSPSHDSTTISFHEDEAIHVAIASISSPKESYQYYNDLLNYISDKIGIPIHPIQKQSYQEVNQLLFDGAVDFAFICSGAYIDFDNGRNVELLVAPVINNKNHYHACLITHSNSGVKSFKDLKGKQFAFSDPLSHTGYNYPIAQIIKLGEDPEKFFSKSFFSYGHDLTVEMVNREMVEGAYVHGHIYDYLLRNKSPFISNTRLIEVSEPFGIPPVVCPKNLDKKRFALYQEIFLNLHNEGEGRRILDRLNIDRFELVDDSLYDSVREIKTRYQR